MRLSESVILEYEKFMKNIPLYIESSGKKKMYIAERAEIPYKTFARKLKALTFTIEESKKIVNAINNIDLKS